ncbi:MAG: TetR family transcriptional regulator [Planctomycetales bacterium 12-60-4]|nr:MAG: TetR family transcriptional regulator [Planctomycetales bacterium 12-60-4]
MSQTPSTTDRICQAAIRTVTRDGLLAMTLDNVAKEAGVSKGGVMYHFPTKELLVTGMLTHFGEQAERMLMTRIANDPEPRRRWARALLSCVFPEAAAPLASANGVADDAMSPEIIQQFLLTIIAAAANNPGLVEPLRQVGSRMRDRLLSDPEDGFDQLLIWLAVDGLLLWQFVGLIDQSDPLFRQIGEALRQKTAIAAPRSIPQRKTRKPAAAVVTKTKGGRRER